MMRSTDFVTFQVPSFLKQPPRETTVFDNVQVFLGEFEANLRALIPWIDWETLDRSVRSPGDLFALIEGDQSAELSFLEWLFVFHCGANWKGLPADRSEAIAHKVWQFIQDSDTFILPFLYALLEGLDAANKGELRPFSMPPVLIDVVLTQGSLNAKFSDILALLKLLKNRQYIEVFQWARSLDLLPKGLFKRLGLPTHFKEVKKVEASVVSWFQADASPERADWLVGCFEAWSAEATAQVHQIVSDLLCRVSPKVGSEHPVLVRWLGRYWYRSAEGRSRWECLSDKAKEALPHWLSIGGWSDFGRAIQLINPLLKDWEQNQLKRRPEFWSHYTSRFQRVRILFCQKSHAQLTADQQRLFERLEPSRFSEDTEVCIFDFGSHYVVEVFRGEISEMRIFPQTEALETVFFQSESLSLLQIREQVCNLDSQVYDHAYLWQGYAEAWLRKHGIKPNDHVKVWRGLPPNAAQYSPDQGLPEPSESKKQERQQQLERWWRNLRRLQARITPEPEPELIAEPVTTAAPTSVTTFADFVETVRDLNLEMVAIPAGKFLMGSPEDEEERDKDESPQHEVSVPGFYMGKFAVTQAQWRVVAQLPQINRSLNADPSRFKGDNRPVERVSWDEAQEFCARLSQATGKAYRLPSEAQWEYACRAGSTTPFAFGATLNTDIANYDGNYTYGNSKKGVWREQTVDVGSFPPNAWGLYEMHGNVWECVGMV